MIAQAGGTIQDQDKREKPILPPNRLTLNSPVVVIPAQPQQNIGEVVIPPSPPRINLLGIAQVLGKTLSLQRKAKEETPLSFGGAVHTEGQGQMNLLGMQSTPPASTAKLVLEVYNGNSILSTQEQYVSKAGETAWEELAIGMNLPPNTTSIVAYMKYEGGTEVYFDDLKIEITDKPVAMVVQENHYYPFGLGMKGLDYVAPSPNVENKFTFNGQTEKEISLGLNWFETVYRSYDPQLGRFTQIDPLADYFTSNTTYDYAFGNPIMFNDPFGLSPNGELPSLVKRMWLNLRLSIKKAAHSLGLAKNNYIKYSSKDNFADRHMGYFMPVFGGSKDKPTNTDSQTNDSQIVDNNNTSKAGEINSNDNDIKLIQSTPNISFPAPETTLPNIQPYKPNVPSTQGVALADRWLNGPITQKAAPPQIISGMNILREIANYLIIANGMRLTTNNVIIITGLTTSFNNNRTLNFRDGTFYDRNTLGRIMNARLAFVQQTLSNMGVQNWQIRISNALFIQYNSPPDALNRSQIQMRFIRQ